MTPTGDELAGIVDLFGTLTRDELERAVTEVAARRGEPVDSAAVATSIEDAVDDYHLVTVEGDGGHRYAAGPRAFPALPDGGEDLPHVMDVERRALDRASLGEAATERFREDVDAAVGAGDRERLATLLDASYDVEAWAPVSLDAERDRIDDTLGESPPSD